MTHDVIKHLLDDYVTGDLPEEARAPVRHGRGDLEVEPGDLPEPVHRAQGVLRVPSAGRVERAAPVGVCRQPVPLPPREHPQAPSMVRYVGRSAPDASNVESANSGARYVSGA